MKKRKVNDSWEIEILAPLFMTFNKIALGVDSIITLEINLPKVT